MSNESAKVTVVTAADGSYALPLAVMLQSTGANLATESSLEAFVLDDGIAEEDKRLVEQSLPSNTRLHWRKPVSDLSGLPVWGRMPLTTYQKILVADWTREGLERAIWLDCDILTLEDITPLWEINLEGCVVGAVQDQRVPLLSTRFGVAGWREMGLQPDAKYFNAGVLCIDLARWRELEVSRRSLEYLDRHGRQVYFWDQEALNSALHGSWIDLDPKWNRHPSLDRPSRHLRSPRLGPRRRNPPRDGIVHFSGSMKPWATSGGGPAYELYQRYVDRTAWAGRRPRSRWSDHLRTWYEGSRLRRWLYPTEQWAVAAERALTRRAST